MSIKKETIKVKAPKVVIKKVKDTPKDILVDIEKEFEVIIAKLKVQLTEKKFKTRIKKAIKLLTHGLDKKKAVKTKAEKPAPAAVKTKKVAVKKIAKNK